MPTHAVKYSLNNMDSVIDSAEFHGLSLAEQQRFLSESLTPQSFESLLLLCAELADTSPLVYLIKTAQSRGLPMGAELGPMFLRFFTPALQKVLELPGLEEAVAEAWRSAMVEHLVSFALLDRYLRRRHPKRWRAGLDLVAQQTEQALARGEVPDSSLVLRLEGVQQRRLQTTYPKGWEQLRESWWLKAREAIRHLAARPRDVSLANAEKLLSQQVYTDQGHFLLELLQNADDAGATEFEVRFEDDSITVSHDGNPFDFRDFVGVLSIGQTTKTDRQIGYFGVGFKSVFEVADRPRIFSGFFSFEIVDISVPRYLKPLEEPTHKTVLTLPLKPGLGVDPFYQRALQIPETLLLNLPNVRTLRWIGPQGEVTELTQSREGDVHTLARAGRGKRYRVWEGHYQHSGVRPEGKPQGAKVMVALPLDETHLEHNLFSFLPIQEHSGLRFLVGSHFDVPVDRERLDQHSTWNRGIIDSIPDIIESRLRAHPQLALQVLSHLPLPEDAVAPSFAHLAPTLVKKLADLPLYEHPQKGWRAAPSLELIEPELSPLFTEEERARFLDPADDRCRKWLIELGAKTYDLKQFLLDMASGMVPQALTGANKELWGLFHRLVLQSPSFDTWQQKLRGVPLFLDGRGRLSTAQQLFMIPEEWEAAFKRTPRSLHPDLRELSETDTLMASLRVRELRFEDLLALLARSGLEYFEFEPLVGVLLSAPKSVQRAFLRLPLFEDSAGARQPLAEPATFQPGLLVAAEGAPLELFPDLAFSAHGETLRPLLQACDWALFAQSEALRFLSMKGTELSGDQAARLREWLLSRPPFWATMEDLQRLAELPIFESTDGRVQALHELWQADSGELLDHLGGLQLLKPESDSARLVEYFDLGHLLEEVDLDTVVDQFERGDPKELLSILSRRADELSRQQILRVLARPVVEGRSVAFPGNPDRAAVAVAEPGFIPVFEELGWVVADPDTNQALYPLMKAAGLPPAGLPELMKLFREYGLVPPVAALSTLHAVLLEHREELLLSYTDKERASIPVWLCADAKVRSAATLPPDADIAGLLDISGELPAEGYPKELDSLFPRLSVREFLDLFLQRHQCLHRPLSRQPACLNTVEKVDRLAYRVRNQMLAVAGDGRVTDDRLLYAPAPAHTWLRQAEIYHQMLHPDSAEFQNLRAQPLPPVRVLEYYALHKDSAECRDSFYEYLSSHMGSVLTDEDARRYLCEQPIWQTAGSGWRALNEMVLEPDFADLGLDWYPSAEIPESLIEQLRSSLQVGRPDPATLFCTVLPHYFSALDSGADTEPTLGLLEKVSAPISGWELRRLYSEEYQREFAVAGAGGAIPISSCYAPPPGLRGLSCLPPRSGQHLSFLRKMGLPYLPQVTDLRRRRSLSEDDAQALEELVSWMWEERPKDLEGHLEFLCRFAFLADREGRLKAPVQLYIPNGEVEELIGDFPDLFPSRTLPLTLFRALGLRDEHSVEVSQVLRFLRLQIDRKERLGSRFYSYLDEALERGVVDGLFLKQSLQSLDWIYADEGEYRAPGQVLGFPGFRYFGPYRSTWERSNSRFPSLTRLFGIPEQLSSEVVLSFLQEVAEGRYPECPPRILINCLAYLGEVGHTIPKDWKVLPGRRFPGHNLELVAASQKGVVRSNSPTLASLFGQGGTLWVVETDDIEHGEVLDELYARLAVPRLRDAYTVKPDASGRDITAKLGEQVSKFRALLRAVDSVLPRLKAARSEWSQGEWTADKQLRPFGSAAPIKVIEGLSLFYELPGVSRVSVKASLAFDPDSAVLYVSAAAVNEPTRYALELADGLADCIYQGAGVESLVDLLNLLLLYADAEQMNRYLDCRHFPKPFQEQITGLEPWRERLGEILDYGLHHALARLFPECKEAEWQRWRDPAWIPATETAREFLARIGLPDASSELEEALTDMLESEELRMPSVEMQAVEALPEEELRFVVSDGAPSERTETPRESAFSSFRKKLVKKLTEMVGAPGMAVQGLGARDGETTVDMADTYKHPPERHILFSERKLSGPSLYCLDEIYSNFDSKKQMYVPGFEAWNSFFVPSGQSVQFSGVPTLGERPLPVPFYARLKDWEVEDGEARVVGPDHLHRYRVEPSNQSSSVRYTVELSQLPEHREHDRVKEFDPRLLSTTVTLPSLPADLRKWIEWARGSGLPHWQLADRATELVRGSYKYDVGFTQLEAVKEVLARPVRPGENRILEMLHAGAGGRYLGRGLCTELAAVLLELLRHCGVPCALGGVWMLDEGLVHVPDHSIVLAWLPSEYGPFWMPLEATGARMDFVQKASEVTLTRLELLEKAAALILTDLDGLPTSLERRQRFLQDRLLGVLGHSDLLEVFLECLARPGWLLHELGAELQDLARRGYIRVQEVPMFEVRVPGRD